MLQKGHKKFEEFFNENILTSLSLIMPPLTNPLIQSASIAACLLLAVGCEKKEVVLAPSSEAAPAAQSSASSTQTAPGVPAPEEVAAAAKATADAEEAARAMELQKQQEEQKRSATQKEAAVAQAKAEMTGKAIGNYTYKNQVFEEVKVKEVTNEGFKVTHKNGSGTFLFQHMPEPVQQRFGYDAAAVAAASSAAPVDPAVAAATPAATPVPTAPAAGAGSDAVTAESILAAQRKKEVDAMNLASQTVMKAEISSLSASIPQLESQITNFREEKRKAEYEHWHARRIEGNSSSWTLKIQRLEKSIAATEQQLTNVRSRIASLESQLRP